jgi:hypothetical protein
MSQFVGFVQTAEIYFTEEMKNSVPGGSAGNPIKDNDWNWGGWLPDSAGEAPGCGIPFEIPGL